MEVWRDLRDVPVSTTGRAVSIGFYDGVHLGHRLVLADLRSQASERGLASVVVTFDRHPAQVLRPESAPLLLCDLDQRLELLAQTGIDAVLALTFDVSQSHQTAEQFVEIVLRDALAARLIEVGEDFHFGHRRLGNVALLEDMGRRCGFEVIGHPLVGDTGESARPETAVSSTAIRRALADGRLADAVTMLGRPHEMRGPVVRGDQRGRLIGFPTANVAIGPELLVPADGIYAGRLVREGGSLLDAAIYVGKRPTFYEDAEASLLEVHCLDFEGNLYGERVGVRFEHHLRGDQKFDSVDELADQLARDCEVARALLRRSR